MGSFKNFKVHKRLPVPTLTISFCKFLKKIYFIAKFCDLLGIRVRVSIVLEVEPDPKYLKFVSASAEQLEQTRNIVHSDQNNVRYAVFFSSCN